MNGNIINQYLLLEKRKYVLILITCRVLMLCNVIKEIEKEFLNMFVLKIQKLLLAYFTENGLRENIHYVLGMVGYIYIYIQYDVSSRLSKCHIEYYIYKYSKE